MKDLKYLVAYIAPIIALVGIYYGGFWSFGALYFGFVFVPILELFLPGTTENLSPQQEEHKLKSKLFDFLIYLNLPLLYLVIFYYFYRISSGGLSNFEIIGMSINTAVVVGAIGINVAHELGHRDSKWEQLMSKIMLLPSLYMHFFIEHNRGHHKNVATDEDPASSRLGESLYAFWIRSVSGSYKSAWTLEHKRLQKEGKSFISFHNEMIWYQLIQFAYLFTIALCFGSQIVVAAIFIAIGGFLLLETVNYIEHYGLRRKKLASGRYEPVQPHHSWNSNHEIGRIFLYELTRHSDHHYKANRKYQILRHFDEAPQLPLGYPGAMLVSTIPPLWFKLMDEKALSMTRN